MLLLVVAFGRYAHGRQLVEQAAAAAARAASLSATAAQADGRARQAASASLSDAGVSCTVDDHHRRHRRLPGRRDRRRSP